MDKKGKLIITHGKPQKNASQDTKSRWVKDDTNLTGIDFSTYSASSCSNISFSEKKPFNEILKKGYWSKEHIFMTKIYFIRLKNSATVMHC